MGKLNAKDATNFMKKTKFRLDNEAATSITSKMNEIKENWFFVTANIKLNKNNKRKGINKNPINYYWTGGG